jgi:hypothetical protein
MVSCDPLSLHSVHIGQNNVPVGSRILAFPEYFAAHLSVRGAQLRDESLIRAAQRGVPGAVGSAVGGLCKSAGGSVFTLAWARVIASKPVHGTFAGVSSVVCILIKSFDCATTPAGIH